MNLKEAAKEVLDHLQNVLDHIIPGDYTIIIKDLNSSIGEHTRHHLAIIKSAIIEKCNYIDLPKHFGIASSTIRYKNSNK